MWSARENIGICLSKIRVGIAWIVALTLPDLIGFNPTVRRALVSKSISGRVVKVDTDGSLVTDIDALRLSDAPRDASVRIVVDEHETFGIFSGEHGQPSMTLVAILDEELPLKISLIDDSASAMLGVSVGAPVKVHW